MFRKVIFIILLAITSFNAKAQSDSSHLRVSLLTCGTGPESWQTFGHTAVRVVDSVNGTDFVYNYGTFSFGDDFVSQFVRGKLLYYVSFYAYELFVREYVDENRSVEERLLILDGEKKRKIQSFLNWNSEKENRYYKYDFFYDNCATRIRNIFPEVLGKNFKYGETIAAHKRITFRQIINQYYYYKHWERFGVNILLGSRIDLVMNNSDIMFLPDFLNDGIGGATIDGKKIAQEPTPVVEGHAHVPVGLNEPFVVTMVILILTALGLFVKPLKPLGNAMQFILLFVTGLLGCLMLVMWFGTDHQGCSNNFNLLWALPTNLFIAFAKKKNKGRYAIVAIGCIIIAYLLHMFRVQEMLLLEFSPLLLSLLLVYGMIYRRDTATTTV